MTSTLRFNSGDVRLSDEERRELQNRNIELKANQLINPTAKCKLDAPPNFRYWG
jgi:hypothetical protein